MLAWSHTSVLLLQLLVVVVDAAMRLLRLGFGCELAGAAVPLATLQYSPVPWSMSTTGSPGLTGAAGLLGLTGRYCEHAVLPLALLMSSGWLVFAGVMRQPVKGVVVSLRLTGVEGGSGAAAGGGGEGGGGGP
jgi:hypothetical protein